MPTKIVPMYHQIYLTLRNDLDHGKYRADRPFPSEFELAKKFGVSRVTLRHTMALLERDGLIVRRPGIGTFPVKPDPRVKFRSSMESFNETARSASSRYESTVIDRQTIPTPPFIREQFPNFGDECVQVRLVSRDKASGIPVHFGTHYVPSALAQPPTKKRKGKAGVGLGLRKLRAKSGRTDLVISTALADLDASKILEVQAGSPLIVTKRLSLDQAGHPIEYLQAFTRPDQYEYVFRFSAGDSNGPSFHDD